MAEGGGGLLRWFSCGFFDRCCGWLPVARIHLRRGLVVEVLMWPPGVVALHPLPDACFEFPEPGVFLEVEILVFVALPEPLDEDIVHPAALSVHAHGDAQPLDPSGPLRRGELAALVGVEDLW